MISNPGTVFKEGVTEKPNITQFLTPTCSSSFAFCIEILNKEGGISNPPPPSDENTHPPSPDDFGFTTPMNMLP